MYRSSYEVLVVVVVVLLLRFGIKVVFAQSNSAICSREPAFPRADLHTRMYLFQAGPSCKSNGRPAPMRVQRTTLRYTWFLYLYAQLLYCRCEERAGRSSPLVDIERTVCSIYNYYSSNIVHKQVPRSTDSIKSADQHALFSAAVSSSCGR